MNRARLCILGYSQGFHADRTALNFDPDTLKLKAGLKWRVDVRRRAQIPGFTSFCSFTTSALISYFRPARNLPRTRFPPGFIRYAWKGRPIRFSLKKVACFLSSTEGISFNRTPLVSQLPLSEIMLLWPNIKHLSLLTVAAKPDWIGSHFNALFFIGL